MTTHVDICASRFQSNPVLRYAKHLQSGYGCDKSTSTAAPFGIVLQGNTGAEIVSTRTCTSVHPELKSCNIISVFITVWCFCNDPGSIWLSLMHSSSALIYDVRTTDLHIYNLNTVPPIHVVSYHVDTDKLTTANDGTFTSSSASRSSQSR